MLSRRSLLGRCLSALGVAALAPIAKMLPEPTPSKPSARNPSRVRCFAILRETYCFSAGRAEPERVAYCLDGETSVREWDRARHGGTWISFKAALSSWGRA